MNPSCPIPIFSYIYIYLELPYPKKSGFCKISQFSEWKPGFPLAASSAAFDAGLLTGFYWIFTNFYGIFTGFRQVSKTSSSSKSRFSVPKPLFLGFRSKTWFLSRNPLCFRRWKSYRYLYLSIYIYIHIINAPVLLANSPISPTDGPTDGPIPSPSV